MQATELVDLGTDLAAARRLRRRRLFGIVLPLACAVLVVGGLIAVIVQSYGSNRRDALNLLEEVLDGLNHRIGTEVSQFLSPAAAGVFLAGELLDPDPIGAGRAETDRLALLLLRQYRQLLNFIVAGPDGDVLIYYKQPDGAVHTRVIEHSNGTRRAFRIYRDVDGAVVQLGDDPDDGFDPTIRPWFQGAVAARGLHWSDVYVFFASRQPGITVSVPVFAEDGSLRTVFGIDITLEDVSHFLAGLDVGARGEVMIVQGEGLLVAFPDPARMLKDTAGQPVPARLDDLGDPVLTRAFNQFRIDRYGRHEIEIGGDNHIMMVSALQVGGIEDWWVLVVVPETDIIGFVARNTRETAMMSAGVVALTLVLAVALVRQGLRADRNAAFLRQRQETLERHSQAFADIAVAIGDWDVDAESAAARITETVANAVGARRVGLWRWVAEDETLVLKDNYDRQYHGHTADTVLSRRHLAALLDALEQGQSVDVPDVARDDRTRELVRPYLGKFGIRSFLAVPIVRSGELAGAFLIEDRADAGSGVGGALLFIEAVAGLLAPRWGRLPRSVPASEALQATGAAGESSGSAVDAVAGPLASPEAMRETALLLDRRRVRDAQVQKQAEDQDGAVLAVRAVTVLVAQFGSAAALAQRIDDGLGSTVLQHLSRVAQAEARRLNVPYLKVAGTRMIAAGFDVDGSDGAEGGAAGSLADLALALRDACAKVSTAVTLPPDDRFAMDTGTAFGADLDADDRLFNLWGGPVQLAGDLVMAATHGSTVVSHATFVTLRNQFVFRARGAFYIEGLGETPIYVLSRRS
ncbi:MAG: GAF domain-containing protein [Rhodospirillales bacterium]|nr:MAG: GAF domain-containing protein [Rhodospirillales bacterium]